MKKQNSFEEWAKGKDLLLMVGSRSLKHNAKARQDVKSVIERAYINNYSVVVGDATGVDYFTIQECHRQGVKHLVVHVQHHVRNYQESSATYSFVANQKSSRKSRYTERDKFMLQSVKRHKKNGNKGIVVAIWDRKSPGTKATIVAAYYMGMSVTVLSDY